MFVSLIDLIFNIKYMLLGTANGQSFPPPLPPQEEREYFGKCRAGDAAARERLIEHNLRLVAHMVRKYYSTSKNQEDLISIGSIGLIKAIDTFKYENGARFATYAAKCIQNEILMFFRSQKKLAGEISINETIDTDRDGNPLTYIDIISCEDTIADDIDIKIRSAYAVDLINRRLSQRERSIILLRYGLDGRIPMTQREVAEKLKISRSYISRIEKSALEKICNWFEK